MSPVVDVRNLFKRYDDVAAVNDISFTLNKGHIVGLLGGNGAGKTTTLSMLLGILIPTSGTIRILEHDMAKDRHRALERMNFSSPYVDLPSRLRVRENLMVYGHLYGVKNLKDRITKLSNDLGLGDFLDRPHGTLSAGQKTRASLAKALINTPDVLLLDEPTASLDPDTADWVRQYLVAYQKETGAAIFLASHNMPEVEKICDDVIIMKQGRIVDRDPPEKLIARYGRATMEDVFLDIARRTEAA
jgi:ABC-2 type transport system ATP-binding protein